MKLPTLIGAALYGAHHHSAQAFYLPGVAPKSFVDNEMYVSHSLPPFVYHSL